MASDAAALVVHDLKNELGALEAALERGPPEVQALHRQCRALRQRFVSYLTLYGSEAELRAHCDDESPLALLQLVARRQSSAGGLQVGVADSCCAPPYWHFDRRLAGMALDAAVHNALRFARSRVELTAREEAGCLVLVVDDDGPGLGPEASAVATDTGLGTALCRAVAHAHGGRRDDGGVRLFNRAEGGARFELWLPT